MKKTVQSILSLLLALLLVLCFAACEDPDEKETPSTKKATTTQETTASASAEDSTEDQISKTGLWKDATYLSNKEFGEGKNTAKVEVKVADQMITFTIHTDKETVGAALMEHELISGEDGAYGLYIKKVNGITADFDVDQSYWAFYINGEYAMTGVDTTKIKEGEIYQLAYTK